MKRKNRLASEKPSKPKSKRKHLVRRSCGAISLLETQTNRQRRGDLLFDGIRYASSYEVRMVKILKSRGIKFKYGQRFNTTKNGKPNQREVDFLLETPVKAYWCPTEINAIEVKGRFDLRSWLQRRELRNAGIITFIAGKEILEFWEKYAFLRSELLPENISEPPTETPNAINFTFRGREYHSEAAFNFAQILDKHNIPFRVNQVFLVGKDSEGKPQHQYVDFWLSRPIKIFWCPKPVRAIQIRQCLDPRSWHERRFLRNMNIITFIATPDIIAFWTKHGFLRTEQLIDDRKRRKR